MTLQELYNDLRAIPWLPYTFELDVAESQINARGPRNCEIYLYGIYIYIGATSYVNFYSLVEGLIRSASEDILKTYLRWVFTEHKIVFVWQNEERTRAIIAWGRFAYEAAIDGGYITISQGGNVKHQIITMYRRGSLYDILQIPQEDEYESAEPFYKAARRIKKRYARECPFMHARYKAIITRTCVNIAGVNIDVKSPTEYSTILLWERQMGIAAAVNALPQPIAEEIAPHLL